MIVSVMQPKGSSQPTAIGYRSPSDESLAEEQGTANVWGNWTDLRQLNYDYGKLWQVLAGQNASLDSLYDTDSLTALQVLAELPALGRVFEKPGNILLEIITDTTAFEVSNRVPRVISLAEAQRIATKALIDAEARRNRERQAEADFWASMEDH